MALVAGNDFFDLTTSPALTTPHYAAVQYLPKRFIINYLPTSAVYSNAPHEKRFQAVRRRSPTNYDAHSHAVLDAPTITVTWYHPTYHHESTSGYHEALGLTSCRIDDRPSVIKRSCCSMFFAHVREPSSSYGAHCFVNYIFYADTL